jgi:hypothetical protein
MHGKLKVDPLWKMCLFYFPDPVSVREIAHRRVGSKLENMHRKFK